ncbi:MAG: ubiquinone/menaquinone biosynthesis methyltransferase [Candidatus Hydrogenedentota bacterium]|nr:MAG: ubiquinone/menaquinone biosynthesis methyltransferase [Candidatus Hydrogenedentota bacterium]
MSERLSRIEGSFDSRIIFRPIVPVYDLLNRILSFGRDQHWRRVLASSTPPGRVLDLACGTGDVSLALIREADRLVVGTDILPEMLLVAARKTRRRQVSIPFVAARAESLSFRSGLFDAATIAFGIRNFQDRSAALKEIRRVLKNQGELLILEFSIPENLLFRNLYLFYFRRVLPWIGRLISRNSASYSYLPESVLSFPPPKAFAHHIESLGFRVLSIKPLSLGIVTLYRLKKNFPSKDGTLKDGGAEEPASPSGPSRVSLDPIPR